MNFSKKWRVATAAVVTLALVGSGAVAANAADADIVPVQSNGSKGSFYVWNGATGEYADIVAGQPAPVYNRTSDLIITGSSTDVSSEIVIPAGTVGTPTGAYRFIAKASELSGGRNTWRAYQETFPTGPTGGLVFDNFTIDPKSGGNNGGVESVFSEGGEWLIGVAFTINNGVTPIASTYRTMTVNAAADTFTLSPVETTAPVADLIVEADLVAPELGSAEPAVDTTIVPIQGGAANAGKTLKVGAFVAGARIELGNVVLDGTGNGSVDVAGKGIAVGAASKLFVYENNGLDEVLRGWDSFTLTATPPLYSTDLTVEVTNSGRFELVAPAATTIDLGDVRRNRTTTPVALGNVTVFDDRDVLSGWNLNISAAAFQGAGATTVAATALGYSPVGVFLPSGVTLGSNKIAGEGAFGILAQGAVGSATGEFEGAVVNTDLTFKAPINAAKGVHTSTLTLDLVSK